MIVVGTSIGIEISGKDLRVAVLRSIMGKLRFMTSFEVADFRTLAPEEQKASVTALVRKHKVHSGRVFLSLPRDRGIVRQIEFPVEVEEKLKAAVALQLETLCPWTVDEIYWDFVYSSPKKGAKTINTTVVMIPRSALDPWIEFFKSINLTLSGASLSSVACAHAVRALWADENATIVLDCEAGYVEASLLSGSRLTSVTQAGENVSGAAKTASELVVSVGRIGSPEGARVIAYGSTANSLESVARVALPLENANLETSGRFGAIASALLGLKKTPFQTNLVPREIRHRQGQLQLVPSYVLLAAVVLLGTSMAVRGPYQTRVYASRLDQEIRRVSPAVKELSSQEAELNKLSEKYRALAANLQNRDYNLEALRELSRSLPATDFLTNYNYQSGTVTLSGIAASASEVQKHLEDSPLFKDVQFTSSVTRDAGGKDRFTIKVSIEAPQ